MGRARRGRGDGGKQPRAEAATLPGPKYRTHIPVLSSNFLGLAHSRTHTSTLLFTGATEPHFPIVHCLGQFTRPPPRRRGASTLSGANCFSAGVCPRARKWPTFLWPPLPALSFFTLD